MKLLVLSARDVEELLSIDECVAAMREALAALARSEAVQPLRTVFRPEGAAGLMALMPSYRGAGGGLYGLKAICVFPGNPRLGKDSHQGGVLLFDGATGEPLALVNASAITEIRTAAVSAVATDLLARPQSETLAVIGAGVQARAHIMALTRIRPISRVRVASRNIERARRLAEQCAPLVPAHVEAVPSVQAALQGADVVVTATTAAEPVLRRDWLAAGAHVNAVGSSVPSAREIDTATMASARIYVDRRESALNEAGDYLAAAREGAIGPEHIVAEIGELLTGTAPGRRDGTEITLFESLGLAVQDLATAALVFDKAARTGAGTRTDF